MKYIKILQLKTYNFDESIHKHIHKHKSTTYGLESLELLEFLELGFRDFGISALQPTMCAKVGDSRAVLGRLDGSNWSDPTSADML